MSFVTQGLCNAEKITLDEIIIKVPKLLATVNKIKSEVIDFLEHLYVKYEELSVINVFEVESARSVYDEINELQENLKDILKRGNNISDEDIQKYERCLVKMSRELEMVITLLIIHKVIKTVTTFETEKLYLQCLIEIKNVDKHIQSLSDTRSDINEFYAVSYKLFDTITSIKVSTLLKCEDIFEDNVIIDKSNLQLNIKIKETNNEMEDVLKALYFYNGSLRYMDICFWNEIFVSAVDFTTEIKITQETNENFVYNVMEIIILDKLIKPPYYKVFDQLIKIIHFLKNNFDYKLNETTNTLKYIGSNLKDNLSELIIKHCLENTIPSNIEELKKYDTVISNTEKLEKLLINSNIFDKHTTSILAYAKSINILYITKRCQEYFNKAQNIMKKDLNEIEEVVVPRNISNPLTYDSNIFQHCSVSKSVNELIQLTENILKKALKAPDVIAGRQLCVLKKIFQTYTKFVPEYHKKLLQNMPQQVAIFHNNCLYLSYRITQWNALYCEKVTPLSQKFLTSFISDASLLNTVGSEIFCHYVEEQIEKILSIMKNSGLQTTQVLHKVELVIEKSIRQCIRQLELLKRVWDKVLSYAIFNETIGYILHSFCDNLIDLIIKFENIHGKAAEQLVETIKIITICGPKLFTDPKEINLYVSSWCKLNELVFILSSSLFVINDCWADDKGTLAKQFKPEEMRKLIKALFQNTDERATILAKIV